MAARTLALLIAISALLTPFAAASPTTESACADDNTNPLGVFGNTNDPNCTLQASHDDGSTSATVPTGIGSSQTFAVTHLIVPCANPGVASDGESDGGFTFCFGADITIDDIMVAKQQSGTITGPFPITLPADTPTGAQPVITPPDFTSGAPAHVTIQMERVSITKDGTPERAPAPAVDKPIGPSIKVAPCLGAPVTPHTGADGGFDVCIGADITVDGTAIPGKVTKTVTGPFPVALPITTPKVTDPAFLTFTAPNFTSGAPAALTIEREQLGITKDGQLTHADADPVVLPQTPGIRIVPCASAPVAPDGKADGGIDFCVGADIFVNGQLVVPHQAGNVAGPFPRTLPADSPAVTSPNPVSLTGPDFATGEPLALHVKMERVTLTKDGPTSAPADDQVVPLTPPAIIVPCPPLMPAPNGGVDGCVGADITINGKPITTQMPVHVPGALPKTLPFATPALRDPNPVTITPPDFTAGTPAHVTIRMETLTIEPGPTTTSQPSQPREIDLTPGIQITPCVGAPVTPHDGADGGFAVCLGADIKVNGALVASQIQGDVPGPFPRTIEGVPAIDQPNPVSINAPDFSTGAPGSVTVKQESVTLTKDGKTQPTPSDPKTITLGVPVLVVPCASPGLTPHGSEGAFDYCFGADITVNGTTIASQQTGTTPTVFPQTLPVATPVGAPDVTLPDLTTGRAANVSLQMQFVTIHGDGSTTNESAPTAFGPQFPSVQSIPCAQTVVRHTTPDGGFRYCVGADIKINGQLVAARQQGDVDGPFPVSIPDAPAVDQAGFVSVHAPDFATGDPASVTLQRETVTIDKDGHESSVPSDPRVIAGPAVTVVPCEKPGVTPASDGGFDVCVGADITVDGTAIAHSVREPVPAPLPQTLPVDTPVASPGSVHVDLPDTFLGTPARVRVDMERVTIGADGKLTSKPADPVQADGPRVMVVPCVAAPVTPRPGPDGGFDVCVGADISVEGTPIAQQQKATILNVFPKELPGPVPAIDQPGFLVVTPANTTTGAPAHVTLQMETLSVSSDGKLHAAPADPKEQDVGPSLVVMPCAQTVTRHTTADGGFHLCLGADIKLEGTPVAAKRELDVVGPFPITTAPVPAADQPNFVTFQPPSLETGGPGSLTIAFETITVKADGSTQETPTEAQTIALPTVKVVPCENPGATPHGDTGAFDFCLGADITVAGQVVLTKASGTTPDVFPFALPASTPTGADGIHVSPPDLSTGAPAEVRVDRENLSVQHDGNVSREPAAPFDQPVGPGATFQPCAMAIQPSATQEGAFDFCFGADITVDGMSISQQQKGTTPTVFPFTLPTDTPAAPPVITAANFTSGTPAHVHIDMQRVTIHANGQPSFAPANSTDMDVGPRVKVAPCDAPITPLGDEGQFRLCVGADVTVDGNTVVNQVPFTTPPVFPVLIPGDTPDPSRITVTQPDFATGEPAHVTIGMRKDTTVHGDGRVTGEPNGSVQQDGPSIRVVPCADAPVSHPDADGAVNVCLGADVDVNGQRVANQTKLDLLQGTFPVLLSDVPAADQSGFIMPSGPDFTTGKPLQIVIQRENVTIHGDGAHESTPSAPQTIAAPAVRIVPCAGPALASDATQEGVFDYCVGDDVYVDGALVAPHQEGKTPGVFPIVVPTPVPTGNVTTTPPDTASGAPASVSIEMQNVKIHADGSQEKSAAPPVEKQGPALQVVPCETTLKQNASAEGTFDYCLGVDISVNGQSVASRQNGTTPGALPVTIRGVPTGVTMTDADHDGVPVLVVATADQTIHANGTITPSNEGAMPVAADPNDADPCTPVAQVDATPPTIERLPNGSIHVMAAFHACTAMGNQSKEIDAYTPGTFPQSLSGVPTGAFTVVDADGDGVPVVTIEQGTLVITGDNEHHFENASSTTLPVSDPNDADKYNPSPASAGDNTAPCDAASQSCTARTQYADESAQANATADPTTQKGDASAKTKESGKNGTGPASSHTVHMCVGSDPLRMADCAEDSDKDGRLLAQEALMCSDPTDPGSRNAAASVPAGCFPVVLANQTAGFAQRAAAGEAAKHGAPGGSMSKPAPNMQNVNPNAEAGPRGTGEHPSAWAAFCSSIASFFGGIFG